MFSNYNKNWNFTRGSFYNLSQQPMTMGPGSTRVRITYDDTISGQGTKSFTTLFGNNNELINQFLLYKYFRIKSANIIIFANNLSNVPSYVTVDWNGRFTNTDRLYRQDSTKMVPGFLTRTKVFSFIPPNTTISFNNSTTQSINYTEWTTTDSIKTTTDTFVFPSYYLYDAPADISIPVRFELIVDLRGNQIYEPDSKLKQLNIIPEKKNEEEQIPKPLFYNSNKTNATNIFQSKSTPKESIFNNNNNRNHLFG
jgi:hypothetical protein